MQMASCFATSTARSLSTSTHACATSSVTSPSLIPFRHQLTDIPSSHDLHKASSCSKQHWQAPKLLTPHLQLLPQLTAWPQTLSATAGMAIPPQQLQTPQVMLQPLSAARRLNHEPEPFEGEVSSDDELEMDEFEVSAFCLSALTCCGIS